MAKAEMPKNDIMVTEAEKEKKSIIFNTVRIQSTDRSAKDIKDWKEAMEWAESVYNPVRASLYDIYKRIELDGFLSGVWEKRMAMVANKTIRFSKNKKKVEEMDKLINGYEFRRIIRLLMQSKAYGITGLEFIPGPALAFLEIPRKHIFPHKRYIGVDEFSINGIQYDKMWNIWVVGDKDDLGFYLKCAPYVLWKQGNYADWAEFVEIFGHPFRIFEYDAYDAKTKTEAANLLDNSGSSTGMIIPKQLGFRMEDGKTSNANGDLQNKLKDALNEEIAVLVLGATETTKSSSSSGYAQSETHGKQQDEIIKSDMADIMNWLNSPNFLEVLQSYGYPVEGGEFEFEHEIDIARLKDEKEIDAFLVNTAKLPLDDDYFYDKYGRPKPADYKAMKELQRVPPPADPDKPDPVRSAKKGQKKEVEDQADSKEMFYPLKKLYDFFVRARS